jgi:hypothetical protein
MIDRSRATLHRSVPTRSAYGKGLGGMAAKQSEKLRSSYHALAM